MTQTLEERMKVCEQWETTAFPVGLAKDDHNRAVLHGYLQYAPVLSVQLINILIERHKNELHWLKETRPDYGTATDKLWQLGIAADTRLNHARTDERDKKAADKKRFAESEVRVKARQVALLAAKREWYAIQGESRAGRENKADRDNQRCRAAEKILGDFPEFAEQIRREFKGYLK